MKLTARLLKQLIKEVMQGNLSTLRDLKYTKKEDLTPAGHASIRALYSQAQQSGDTVTREYIESIGINLGEYLGTERILEEALRDFIAETPKLANDSNVIEDMEDYNYNTQYIDGTNELVLGTIIDGGGDRLFDAVAAADPGLKNLLAKIHDYAIKFGKPTKKLRKFAVVPYTDYEWNEDSWGEEL
tara:strand:- start:356 stop:913 length:558 start_codon:yes stop_codon:yes gene_type:complete